MNECWLSVDIWDLVAARHDQYKFHVGISTDLLRLLFLFILHWYSLEA